MNQNTNDRKRRIVACVVFLCESLPGKDKPTEMTFLAYEMGLDDLTIEAIEHATRRAIKSCKFVPSVPELRELCGCLTIEQRTVKAWDAFNHAMRKWNYYHSIVFDDPALNATVHNLGGWMPLSERWADKPIEEWDTWLRKDFERVYRAFVSSGSWGENGTTPLVGYYDRENRSKATPGARPYLVEFKTGLPALPGQDQVTLPRIGTNRISDLTNSIGRQP